MLDIYHFYLFWRLFVLAYLIRLKPKSPYLNPLFHIHYFSIFSIKPKLAIKQTLIYKSNLTMHHSCAPILLIKTLIKIRVRVRVRVRV